MKLFSWNVNGIRAVHKKGFLDWLAEANADIVCLQETKCREDQLPEELCQLEGYHVLWHSAEKPGYSGVSTFSREEPLSVQEGLGVEEFDREGRVLITEHRDFVLINAYFPNSQREHARLPYKLEFCDEILKVCEKNRKKGKNIILCGDLNVAHQEIDLKNPKTNQNNAGFLPEERAWMDRLLSKSYVDIFRHRVKEPDHYTWWSYRPGVRARNIGWRLDYHVISEGLVDRVKAVGHKPEVLGSDHCPVYLELK
jgi:exodeoxyribonuclease III